MFLIVNVISLLNLFLLVHSRTIFTSKNSLFITEDFLLVTLLVKNYDFFLY